MIAPLALGLGAAWLELRHRLRPSSPLRMQPKHWSVTSLSGLLRIEGVLEIHNPHPRMEVFVPDLQVNPVLLGRGDPSVLKVTTRVEADHPEQPVPTHV